MFYAQSLRFDEFIASAEPDVLIVTRNYQTRHFVRLMSSQPVTDLGDQRALGLAKEAIDAYAFVGLYEAFQDSVDLMCCRFGWPFVQ